MSPFPFWFCGLVSSPWPASPRRPRLPPSRASPRSPASCTTNPAAAVPGVTVTATNQATNVAYTGLTNDAGNYIITARADRRHTSSTVELQGFKGVQSTVTLSAAQTARVDFRLEVGTVEERLEVVATGAVLQTENAVVGTKLEREQIEKPAGAGPEPVHGDALHAPGVTSHESEVSSTA